MIYDDLFLPILQLMEEFQEFLKLTMQWLQLIKLHLKKSLNNYVDFMIDNKDELFFIEINTIPGFTDHSLMPMSAKVIGKNFDDLVLDILGETCD